MRHSIRTARSLAPAALVSLLAAAAPFALAAAEKSETGATLVVPAEHANLGTVYHALKGRDAQATFTSDAPLEHIKGTSNEVVGYAVLNEDHTPKIVAGEFHLPVASLDTGIPMRNEHLQSERWMDAATYPDVIFTIASSDGAHKTRGGEGVVTYEMTLIGDMTIKGTSREMRIPATITLMDESEKTRGRAEGDLMAIRCAFNVKLSDFNVAKGDPAMDSGKVSDDLELDVRLFCTNVSPEEMIRKRQQQRQQQQGGQGR